MRNSDINCVGTVQRSGGVTYTKTSIVQVRKAIETKGSWAGLLVPNKVNSFHFEGGWHIGHRSTFTNVADVDDHVRQCLWYMDKELGNRVAFYDIKEGE